MGWASGSSMLSEIIEVINENVESEESRLQIYRRLIDIFEDRDCDTICECVDEDETFDKVLRERDPEWYDDHQKWKNEQFK